jgi:hypothetical protein
VSHDGINCHLVARIAAENQEHTFAGLVLVVKSPQGQLAGVNPRRLGKEESVHAILDCEARALTTRLSPSVQITALFKVALKRGVGVSPLTEVIAFPRPAG